MESSNIIEFIPEGGLPSAYRKWGGLIGLNMLILIFWALVIHTKYPYQDAQSLPFFLLFLIPVNFEILTIKDPVKVTISKDTGVFEFDYIDFFDREKTRTIYLKTAYYNYSISSNNLGGVMRLLIYNNYFKNQVVLRAGGKIGFTRQQLDELVESIKEVQGNLKK